ncbi:hypothetical protein IV203_020998 [Nitzschia inconspicua]|uniref:Uncharacterized protein n=1 Tax=Nitzschia inconspicua TaxID=303405 RepID=A0A9K3KHH2_9STRA|nr:hypothetical protein IV203_020998 [Nitzschia inconspicua]
MVGSRQVVQSRSKADVVDRFFSWGETTFCPHDAVKDSIPLQEDNLDYVFNHMESFICREDVTESPSNPPATLERENSLVEACKNVQAKLIKRNEMKAIPSCHKSKSAVGERRDILDYCFDHLESFACGEKATGSFGLIDVTQRGAKKPSTTPPKEEIEDEVHLYYRPTQQET